MPKRYAGIVSDTAGVSLTMRSRLVQRFFVIQTLNWLTKREGKTGNDNIAWVGHTRSDLAYYTPFKGKKGRPLAKRFAPNGNDGLMSKSQLHEWEEIFSRTMGRLIMNFDEPKAKSIAAGHAWNVMKERYGEGIAKINNPRFGLRQRGDYYIGDRSGSLRRSYAPKSVPTSETVPYVYLAYSSQQFVDMTRTAPVAGSKIPYSGEFDKKRTIVPKEWSATDTMALAQAVAESVPYAATVAASGSFGFFGGGRTL